MRPWSSCRPLGIRFFRPKISYGDDRLPIIPSQWDVPRVNYENLSSQRLGEASSAVRERVAVDRHVQAKRFKGTRLRTNADMGSGRGAVALPA